MKVIRHIALSTMLTLMVFGAVLYTSCSKNACASTTCLNKGACSAGVCVCVTGSGGNNCETIYRTAYVDKPYMGSATYTSSIAGDTVFTPFADTNNTLAFNALADSTNFNGAQLTWNRPGKASVSATIMLANHSGSGSSFSFPETTVDTFTYAGTGNVSATEASLNLIESHPNSPSIVVTLSNFSKK